MPLHGDTHIHMVLDGVYYKAAIARHRPAPDEAWIRSVLAAYQRRGVTFLRDGGDACGAGLRASQLAGEYGIDYRTPCFPIHLIGRYGSFIGRGFEDLQGFRQRVEEVRQLGGHFIKVMISGLMDFDHAGVITGTPLEPQLIRDMIHAAHDAGFAVMAHTNGPSAIHAALDAGVDSLEHGGTMDRECVAQLAETDTVWVPTLVTIGALRGTGRFDEEQVRLWLQRQQAMVAEAARLGCSLALGTDAGAWQVFHGTAVRQEYDLLREAIGEGTDEILSAGLETIRRKFHR